jgi:hypothetical protein
MIAPKSSLPRVVHGSPRFNASPLRRWLYTWYTVIIAELLCLTSVEIA